MDETNIREARKRLSALVAAAERGERVVITRRGKKVARLVSARQEPLAVLPDLGAFRASLKLKGRGLSDEVLAMRREERH
jgi:prevent-host-death family protein